MTHNCFGGGPEEHPPQTGSAVRGDDNQIDVPFFCDAHDFGSEALIDSIARLKANDIAVVGAAETPALACAPQFFTTHDGQKAALLALTDLEGEQNGARIATASDRGRVARAIAEVLREMKS